ncbi:MAG TPA: beta-N-acetylhexosaminidase [Gammaproteobacteria bacterium]|nr:beta-N-acetylhexosaminidase [Gammaproteobacteria bacterium]
MTIGPLMVDIAGHALTAEDGELLAHPLVGGVILFSRNYESLPQLEALTADIHAIKTPPLLIAVDQEGGRVQRFRDGFTRLPPLRLIGNSYAENPRLAAELAETAAWTMAAELAAAGVDFSFAPVVDLDLGISSVIGDRAFHKDPAIVATLARAWVNGVRRAGQIAVAKHFPGHGSVIPDSHTSIVEDPREYDAIAHADMAPFRRMIALDIAAIMMAHVVYPAVDSEPASSSRRWIKEELRHRLHFDGAVFSDDLSMHAVAARGDIVEIARQALGAGCDMLPVCNNRATVERLLDHAGAYENPNSRLRLARLHARPRMDRARLEAGDTWQKGQRLLADLMDRPQNELALDVKR